VDVETFESAARFAEQCGADWRRTAQASPQATVFQTWEWTEAWWQHHGGGGKRFRGLAFAEGGERVGFAALFLPGAAAPLRTLRLAGTGGSDYLDIVAAPGHEAAVATAFFGWLAANRRAWDWADFQQVRPGAVLASCCCPTEGEGSGSGAAAAATAPPAGLRAECWPGETCPFLALPPGDWEAFRKTLGKKLRQNIGYYERALEKQFRAEYRVATAETLAADLEAFFALHQARWQRRWMPGAFAAEGARRFHADVAARLLAAGMLRLHTLLLDGQVRAAIYCFQKGERCYYYLGGFDPELARLSVGTVLTARAIRHAIESDRATEFDFLRGDEPYKYRWGAQDRHNRRVSVTRGGSPRSALLECAGRATLTLEMRLKTWMHRQHGGGGSSGGRKAGGEKHDG